MLHVLCTYYAGVRFQGAVIVAPTTVKHETKHVVIMVYYVNGNLKCFMVPKVFT